MELTEVKEDEVEELIEKPENILEVLRELYEKVLQVTANYNYYTFFSLSTRSLPFFYLTKAYPKLSERFDELREFLGLGVVFKPETEVQDIKEKCTIWGHVQGGLCNLIFNLNEFIWKNIKPNSSLLPIFSYVAPSFKDLKGEYIRKVEEKLKSIGWKVFSITGGRTFGDYYYVYVRFSGIVVIEASYYYYPSYESENFRKYYSGKRLPLVLNDFSPALFLGYTCINVVSNNVIRFER
jgi:hypothetical protein